MVLGALYLKKSVKNVPFKAMVIFVVRKRWDPNEQRTIRKLSPLWIPCPFKDPSHNSIPILGFPTDLAKMLFFSIEDAHIYILFGWTIHLHLPLFII